MEVYELLLSDEQGIDAIAVVGSPAMESQYVTLSQEAQKLTFAKVDQEKQILLGVAMIPNKMISRYDEQTQSECKVFFTAETVKKVSELYLKNGNQGNANLEHVQENPISATIVESWIVEDTAKDKTALYNLDAPVGSWVVAMKVDSKEDWQACKEQGTGFSIEGLFKWKLNTNTNTDKMDFEKLKSDLLAGVKEIFSAKPVEEIQVEAPEVVAAPEAVAETVETPEAEAETPVEAVSLSQVNELVAELTSTFKTELSAMRKEIETVKAEKEALKVELSATPAVSKTITAPVEAQVSLSKTKKGRLTDSINSLLNK